MMPSPGRICRTVLPVLALAAIAAGAPPVDGTRDTPACAQAATPIERSICADPELAALDRQIAALDQTLSRAPWRASYRRAQQDWRQALGLHGTNRTDLRQDMQQRLAAMRRDQGLLQNGTYDNVEEAQLRRSCLGLPASDDSPAVVRRPCRVAEFGTLGQVDGVAYRFLRYAYPTPRNSDLPDESALVILRAGTTPSTWTVEVAERLFETTCGNPRLVNQPGGAILQLPCTENGSAAFGEEFAYRRDGAADARGWRPLDTAAWTAELDARLPRGMTVLRGILPDYERMGATFSLWREGVDPNCCPTGGRGEVRFGWDGDRLVLRDAQFRLGRNEVPRSR